VAQRQTTGDVSVEAAPAVDDGVVDRLEGGEAVADLGHVRPGLGGVVVDAGEHPYQPSLRVQAMVASVPQRWLGASGMIVPSCRRGR
jgi:hypothetical protein